MKRIFTKNQIFNAVIMLAFAMVSNGLMAQHKMTVNTPAGIAGKYTVIQAAFGDVSGDPVTGDLSLADDGTDPATDGCEAFTVPAGTIALIDRGQCDFIVKCQNASDGGAIAVLVCNNTADDPISMTGELDITIPSYMASMADCNTIKVELANGAVNVTLEVDNDCDLSGVTYPDNIIWGDQPGEGDFKDGLNGWTVDGPWEWSQKGTLDKGKYNSSVNFVNSMTWCNGAVTMDSDFLDTGGDGDAGSGDCPSTSDHFCDGYLISPTFDLSSADIDGVVLSFHQNLRQYNSEYYILTSTDNGASWPDSIQINTQYPVNSAHESGVVNVPLCGAAGSSEFKFMIWYRGYYYYWGIDDVMLLNEASYDGYVAPNWYSRYSNYEVPSSQVTDIAFMADIGNNGNGTLADVSLNAKLIGPSLNELYNESLSYEDLSGCATDENKVFENFADVPAEKGEYKVQFTLNSSNDNTPGNNVAESNFFVTDTRFSKVSQTADIGGWRFGGDSKFYTIGAVYDMPNGSMLEGLSTKFEMASSADEYSGFVNVALYKWLDLNSDGEAGPDERILLAFNEIYVANSEGTSYDVEFEVAENQSLVFEDNSTYIVAAHVAPGEADGFYFVSSANSDDEGEYNYNASTFAFNEMGIGRYHMVGATGTDESFDDQESRTFFTSSRLTPRMPLNTKLAAGTETLNNDIAVEMFPNPASKFVAVSLNLNEVSKNVNIQLVSIDGKVVTNENFSNIKNNTMNIDVTSLTSGVYMANIRTEAGFVAKRIVVQK